ncbi:MAG: FHA domain-containing protein [Cenarchaeum sp. SB0669_bin_11]|nr:FHA domain-containing protein [Acidimicrobiia bacterium]MYL10693.1 FHA domain-containing protein [Cenarchaeum sp. SB0669_bin_11]
MAIGGKDPLHGNAPPTGAEPSLGALSVADSLLEGGHSSGGILEGRAGKRAAHSCLEVAGKRFTPASGGIELGRSVEPGGIVVADERVSRHHARFVRIGERLVVTDLESTNGTVIVRDGVRIEVGAKPVALEVGDKVVTLNNVLLAKVVEDNSSRTEI